MYLIYYWCFTMGRWRELEGHEFDDVYTAVSVAAQLYRANPRRVFLVVDDAGAVHASIPEGQVGTTAGVTGVGGMAGQTPGWY